MRWRRPLGGATSFLSASRGLARPRSAFPKPWPRRRSGPVPAPGSAPGAPLASEDGTRTGRSAARAGPGARRSRPREGLHSAAAGSRGV